MRARTTCACTTSARTSGGLTSKKAFDFLKASAGCSKPRAVSREKHAKPAVYSDKSDTQHSNLSLESLKIRVNPVPPRHSIESSAERKLHGDLLHLKEGPRDGLQKKLSQGGAREPVGTALTLNSRASFSEGRATGRQGLDLNLVREHMEKYPVLKMDLVTSLEKKDASRPLGHRG